MMEVGFLIAIGTVALTVGVLSAPFRDNVYWKIVEHLYLGFATAYGVVMAISALQSTLVANLQKGNSIYVVPLLLSIALYANLISKRAGWVSRYPIALTVGIGTAVSMRTAVDSMFIRQMQDTMSLDLFAVGTGVFGNPKLPINNLIMVIGFMTSILFFVFVQPKGKIGGVANAVRVVGLDFVMVSFASQMAVSVIVRVSRLGGVFYEILDPSRIVYTVIFSVLAIISLIMSKEKSKVK